MSLLVPKSKYSRLQIPIGEAPGADAGGPLDNGFEEPANAMPGTLSYDNWRDIARVKTTYNGWQDLLATSSSNMLSGVNGFRLSGEVNDTFADGTYSRVYMSAVTGNVISLWTNGKNVWKPYKIAQGSTFYDLSGRTAFTPFDVFCGAVANVPTLSVINWASQIARATNLEIIDGVYVKQGDYSFRYLGTIFPRTATTFDIRRVRSGANFARMDLWNVVNRLPFSMTVRSGAATWSYDTATWRPANNDANNAFEFTYGLVSDPYRVSIIHAVRGTTANTASRVGTAPSTVGSTTVQTGCRNQPTMYNALGTVGLSANWAEQARLGTSKITWLERGPGTGGTTTWCGSDDGGDTGMDALVWG